MVKNYKFQDIVKSLFFVLNSFLFEISEIVLLFDIKFTNLKYFSEETTHIYYIHYKITYCFINIEPQTIYTYCIIISRIIHRACNFSKCYIVVYYIINMYTILLIF